VQADTWIYIYNHTYSIGIGWDVLLHERKFPVSEPVSLCHRNQIAVLPPDVFKDLSSLRQL
jgi:hypothetical protein